VRELKNVVERAVYRSDASMIREIVFNPFQDPFSESSVLHSFPKDAQKTDKIQSPPAMEDLMEKSFEEAVWQFKVRLLEKALKEAKFNQKKATRILGITYHQFRGLYRKYRENK